MHWLTKLLIYLLIVGGIPILETWIPKDESMLRTGFALTWFLWVLMGLALAVRGTWRFLTSR
jgi:hypothetical protein